MGFDLYSDFIEPFYGENTHLLASVKKLIRELELNQVDYCFAGDLPFSVYCVRQMTTDLDIFIAEPHWHLVKVKLPNTEIQNVVSINENVIPFGDQEESFPLTINLIKVSTSQWQELSLEHTLSAFRIDNLPVVSECSLIPMVAILKSKLNLSGSKSTHFDARLMQAKEKREMGKVDSGYVMSWGELQALKEIAREQ